MDGRITSRAGDPKSAARQHVSTGVIPHTSCPIPPPDIRRLETADQPPVWVRRRSAAGGKPPISRRFGSAAEQPPAGNRRSAAGLGPPPSSRRSRSAASRRFSPPPSSRRRKNRRSAGGLGPPPSSRRSGSPAGRRFTSIRRSAITEFPRYRPIRLTHDAASAAFDARSHPITSLTLENSMCSVYKWSPASSSESMSSFSSMPSAFTESTS